MSLTRSKRDVVLSRPATKRKCAWHAISHRLDSLGCLRCVLLATALMERSERADEPLEEEVGLRREDKQ